MDRTFHKAKNFKEAEQWNIEQQVNMTPEQRQKIAKELKIRFYGKNCPDVRSSRKIKKIKIINSKTSANF